MQSMHMDIDKDEGKGKQKGMGVPLGMLAVVLMPHHERPVAIGLCFFPTDLALTI